MGSHCCGALPGAAGGSWRKASPLPGEALRHSHGQREASGRNRRLHAARLQPTLRGRAGAPPPPPRLVQAAGEAPGGAAVPSAAGAAPGAGGWGAAAGCPPPQREGTRRRPGPCPGCARCGASGLSVGQAPGGWCGGWRLRPTGLSDPCFVCGKAARAHAWPVRRGWP